MTYPHATHFEPVQPLVSGTAHERCRAVVIVPARNEEAGLSATLDALAAQRDLYGRALDPASFEVLLLLNNCTDASGAVARAWQADHPTLKLSVVEKSIPGEDAHVGTARRLLMDTAWSRMRGDDGCFPSHCGILSTDSDTIVAPDWIAQTLRALQGGADAVGGVIELKPGELDALPHGARSSYLADREFQLLFAELEDRLDPQAGDPWPRHREHFGASLACTPEIYARAGGLPPVNPLEDMAFVDRLFRIDARIRHDPAVRVFTSARFDGRASVGLSWQLRTWQHMHEAGEAHTVPSARWLQHRFRTLRSLREVHQNGATHGLNSIDQQWRAPVAQALAENLPAGEFLTRIDCDARIAETYTGGTREAEISCVVRDLRAMVARAGKPGGARRKRPALTGLPLQSPAPIDRSGSGQLDAR